MQKFRASTHVYNKLSEFMFRCTKMNVDYMIAKTLLKKCSCFPDILIEDIAKKALTTPASVTKFCKKIGYMSFYDLRHDIEIYPPWHIFLAMEKRNKQEELSNVFQFFFEQEKHFSQKILNDIDVSKIQQIAQIIKDDMQGIVITPSYALSAVNVFQEIAQMKNINIFKISRHIEEDLLFNLAKDVGFCFIISLTGTWIEKHQCLLNKLSRQKMSVVVFCAQNTILPNELRDIQVIELPYLDEVIQSNYFSYKYLSILFMCIIFSI